MPFFRRKSEKTKAEAPPPLTVPAPNQGGATVKRTPSNRSDHSPLTPSSLNGDIGVPDSVLGGRAGRRPPNLLLQSSSLQDPHQGPDLQAPTSPMRTSSRLSKTLREILHDQNGVACFLHYMKSQKAANLIQFWLDAESFHVSTTMRVRTHSLNSSSGNLGHRSFSARDTQSLCSAKSIEGKTVRSLPDVNSCIEDSIADNSDRRRECTERVVPEDEDVQPEQDKMATQQSQYVHSATPSQGLPDPSSDPGGSDAVTEGNQEGGGEQGAEGGVSSHETDPSKGLSKMDLKEKMKKCIQHDAVTIFTKYISQDAPQPIGVTEQLRAQTIRRMCQENGQVDPDCFIDCQEFVFHRMKKEDYPGFAQSEYHCKHQVDVLTSGKVYLADILYNELALSYFMEFLDPEGACHLLQFWLVADNFQQHLASQGGQYNPNQAQDDAMVLYDKYFSLQATHPLGFDDDIRFTVEGNICREGGPLPDCFAKPRDLVLQTLEQYYFPAYLQSDMYYKYLSDLVGTVQTAQIPHKPKHRRTESDASSEHSAGSQSVGGMESIKNTLLAMDTSHMKRAFTRIEDDMRIDSMLLNPDELWKRTEPGLLSLGKVNDLGQFESLFDPEPDREKKKGTRFFKKKKEKEKEQEDMALRVAQMIINDVTTMTQTGDMYAGVSSSPKLPTRSQQDSAIPASKGGNS